MGHHCRQIQHDSFLSFPLGVELRKYQFLTKQKWCDCPAGVTEKRAVRSDWSQKTSLSSVLASPYDVAMQQMQRKQPNLNANRSTVIRLGLQNIS